MAQRRTKGDGGLTRACSVAGCESRHEARGFCHVHYMKAKRDGLPNLPKPTIEERFWSKVDKGGRNGCWIWTAWLQHGYGWFGWAAADGRYAHRVAYEWLVGPIPDGMQLDHLCRNPPCCNPDHLEVVTPGENYRRGMGFSGINSRKTHCPRHHAYDAANTYIDARGQRHCRKCRARRQAEYKRRARGAA